MGSLSLWHWIVVVVLVLLLFGGRGKISGLMGDFAQGIKSFRRGLHDEDVATDVGGAEQKTISASDARPTSGIAAKPNARPSLETMTRAKGT